ncbi:MAG: tyrosine-type recombinase/integrase [Desulfobacula sp.]|nr:tyrosine-type recombinase/integrase [Desulfobacula sp.]
MLFPANTFRHCGASLLDQGNIPIGSIQKILGHENRTTTEIYLHTMSNAESVRGQALSEYCGYGI